MKITYETREYKLKQKKTHLEITIKTLTKTNSSHRNSISVQKKEIGDTKTTIENNNNTIR